MEHKHNKLFIPGPTEVREEILKEMSRPLIGHRTKEFSVLLSEIVSKLQSLLFTKNNIIVFTSSGTGAMEAAIRNCVFKKTLVLSCGAFGERWAEIAKANGKETDVLEAPWGKAIIPETVEERIKTGKYDAVALVHNETSTGVINPLYEISEILKKYPEICFLVDTVSSMGGVKIEVDKLGIDVIFASAQKCLALPPGLAICAVSQKAIEKAGKVKNRGYYFDFIEHLKDWRERKSTPTTPAISLMYALNRKMDDILLKEGLEKRFERHNKMAVLVQNWAKENFSLFADEKHLSPTITAIGNERNIDIGNLLKELEKRGKEISDGYGKLKGKCFRIAHMGDIEIFEIKELLADIEDILKLR